MSIFIRDKKKLYRLALNNLIKREYCINCNDDFKVRHDIDTDNSVVTYYIDSRVGELTLFRYLKLLVMSSIALKDLGLEVSKVEFCVTTYRRDGYGCFEMDSKYDLEVSKELINKIDWKEISSSEFGDIAKSIKKVIFANIKLDK